MLLLQSVEVQHHQSGSSGSRIPCGGSSTCPPPVTFQAGGGGRGPLPSAPMSREQLEPFLAALAALQEEQRGGGSGDGSDSSSLDNLSCEVQPPSTARTSIESLQDHPLRPRQSQLYRGHAADGVSVPEHGRGQQVGRRGPRRATWCSPPAVAVHHPRDLARGGPLGVNLDPAGAARPLGKAQRLSVRGGSVGDLYTIDRRLQLLPSHPPPPHLKENLQDSSRISVHSGKTFITIILND